MVRTVVCKTRGLAAASLLVVVGLIAFPGESQAQSGSLLGASGARRPLTMSDVSWTYQPSPEPKQWKINDFLTVFVEEKTEMKSEGKVDQRKKVEGSMAMTDWVQFDGWSIVPDPQEAGDPTLAGIVDNKYRAQANLQNKNLFQTQIQCVVTDVRPNGTLVIEGHSRVKVDDEEWELSISGIIRPEDILPNNSVKSEKIAEKHIVRRTAGHGRDGVRRGFLGKFLDKVQPF